jgi:hypothetical protein
MVCVSHLCISFLETVGKEILVSKCMLSEEMVLTVGIILFGSLGALKSDINSSACAHAYTHAHVECIDMV